MHLPDGRYEPISVDEAASRLGVSSSTVRRMIRDGKLQAERETRPQGEIVRVLWPRPEDVSPPATPPSGPPATDVSAAASVALEALAAALESERTERQKLAQDVVALTDRAARAEAASEAATVRGDELAARLQAAEDALSAERARRWWRWW